MGKLHRPRSRHKPGAIEGIQRCFRLHASQPTRPRRLGIGAEHSHRTRQRQHIIPKAAQARHHRPRDTARPESLHLVSGSRDRPQSTGSDLADQLGNQERHTSGRAAARLHELRRRLHIQLLSQQIRDRGAAQRRWGDADHVRIAGQRHEHLLLRWALGRARSDHQRERQPLPPVRQIGKKPQRRTIGPMRVINRQQDGAVLEQIRGNPVQAMKNRENLVRGRLTD